MRSIAMQRQRFSVKSTIKTKNVAAAGGAAREVTMNVSKSLALALARPNTGAPAAVNTLAAAVIAFLIGASLVFTAGFAQTSALHDAAHDSRHSLAFPCH